MITRRMISSVASRLPSPVSRLYLSISLSLSLISLSSLSSLKHRKRDALATLFAAKDRFTVLELELAPWGYDDDSLEYALSSGAVYDIDYWKEIGHGKHGAAARAADLTAVAKRQGKVVPTAGAAAHECQVDDEPETRQQKRKRERAKAKAEKKLARKRAASGSDSMSGK